MDNEFLVALVIVFGVAVLTGIVTWIFSRWPKKRLKIVEVFDDQVPPIVLDSNTGSGYTYLTQVLLAPNPLLGSNGEQRKVLERAMKFLVRVPRIPQVVVLYDILEECLRKNEMPKPPDPIQREAIDRSLKNWRKFCNNPQPTA